MLIVEADANAVADAAAERLTTAIGQAVAQRGDAMVSLTGGETPRRLYARLADPAQGWRTRMPWDRLHLFWGDERHVPPEHPDSNYGMAYDAMLRHVPVPDVRIHRMRGELPDARDAGREYASELRRAFSAAGRADLTFDVMLLGLGEDAHIASIFPGSELLNGIVADPSLTGQPASDSVPPAAGVWAGHLDAWRITLTPRALLDARAIFVVVSGAAKADAVHAALEQPLDVRRWPAQLLRAAAARVTWIVDRAAAARVRDPESGARA